MPDDVSVVGYDNTPESGWYYPPLTTVEQEFRRAGEVGIEQLVRLVEGQDVEPEVLVSPALVVRRSTGEPRDRVPVPGAAVLPRGRAESLSRPG